MIKNCRNIRIALMLFLCGILYQSVFAQDNMPRIVSNEGRHELLVDGKPFLILGGQAHNSSGWPALLPNVWTAIETMHANTLEVPIYWEQIEPTRGSYNFSLIDTLLQQARARDKRLVLLWFATWKNGSNHYMPEWMKADFKNNPNITGINGRAVDSPTPHNNLSMEADAEAFASVMRYLKKADPQHTVIMVQVENESGSWESVRDYSPAAQKLFEGQVPAELLKAEILKSLHVPVVSKGTWKEVFGKDADEYFHAWSIAHYINYVAAAGKAEYPLPLYTNAALRDPLTNPDATQYESGGPTDNVIPIWKAAAPSIDLLAPDIYLQGNERILKVLELYSRKDNPLFVPEIGLTKVNSKYFWPVLAYGGFGYAPFGIDDNGTGETPEQTKARLAVFAHHYAVAEPISSELAKWAYEGKVYAVAENSDHAAQNIDLGSWKAIITFRNELRKQQGDTIPTGSAMIVKLGENEFLAAGMNCHFTFAPVGKNPNEPWQYIAVEEGHYQNGTFIPSRILNGDETDWGGPHIDSVPVLLRIRLLLR